MNTFILEKYKDRLLFIPLSNENNIRNNHRLIRKAQVLRGLVQIPNNQSLSYLNGLLNNYIIKIFKEYAIAINYQLISNIGLIGAQVQDSQNYKYFAELYVFELQDFNKHLYPLKQKSDKRPAQLLQKIYQNQYLCGYNIFDLFGNNQHIYSQIVSVRKEHFTNAESLFLFVMQKAGKYFITNWY